MFADNFLHCDLHPGNLFIRSNPNCPCLKNSSYYSPSSSASSRITTSCVYGDRCVPNLVVFDCGLVVSLAPKEITNLCDLFDKMVIKDFEGQKFEYFEGVKSSHFSSGSAQLLIDRCAANDTLPMHKRERFKNEYASLFSDGLYFYFLTFTNTDSFLIF